MRVFAALLLLAGCDRAQQPVPTDARGAGRTMEAAAIAAGIVADPARLDPVGAYASDTDRVCVLPRPDGGYRIGASVDYADGQGCVARGSATGRDVLTIDFGDDCRMTARFDGTQLTLPATLASACTRRCTGRASLSALTAARLSSTPSEAKAMRDGMGQPLCEG